MKNEHKYFYKCDKCKFHLILLLKLFAMYNKEIERNCMFIIKPTASTMHEKNI